MKSKEQTERERLYAAVVKRYGPNCTTHERLTAAIDEFLLSMATTGTIKGKVIA